MRKALNSKLAKKKAMTKEHISNLKKGLPLGATAPIIETKDIYNNDINSIDLLRKYNGILIDFFRGAW